MQFELDLLRHQITYLWLYGAQRVPDRPAPSVWLSGLALPTAAILIRPPALEMFSIMTLCRSTLDILPCTNLATILIVLHGGIEQYF